MKQQPLVKKKSFNIYCSLFIFLSLSFIPNLSAQKKNSRNFRRYYLLHHSCFLFGDHVIEERLYRDKTTRFFRGNSCRGKLYFKTHDTEGTP